VYPSRSAKLFDSGDGLPTIHLRVGVNGEHNNPMTILMAELSHKTVCFSDKSPDWLRRKSFGDFPKSS
jgi:hypothetical protein